MNRSPLYAPHVRPSSRCYAKPALRSAESGRIALNAGFALLGQTLPNHWGKLAFRYMYFMMMHGIEIPLPNKFSMVGKRV